MRALLLTDYLHLELTQAPEPAVGPEDVLVRVRACGICGSDVHGFDGSTGRRIPPLIMGHEAAGEVAALGSAVRDLSLGQRVTFDSTIYCGECPYCARGQVNLCDRCEVLGVSPGPYRRHGAFAEFVSVPRRIVYPLPAAIGFEQAALIEAISVAVHAIGLVPVRPGDTAVIVGSGMIGLLAIQTAKLAGCGDVVAVDIDDHRLELARQLGASEAVNPNATDPVETVRRLTAGHGADLAIECLGATATVRAAIACTRKGGAVALVGNVAPSVELPLQDVVTRQIRLQGSCASSGEYPEIIRLMAAGKIRVDPLISAVAPLEEGQAWFDRLYRHEANLMKVILRP